MKSLFNFFLKFKQKNNTSKYLLFFIIGLIVIILDQLSKYIIRKTIVIEEHIILVNNFLSFTHIYNTGAAFSILNNQNMLLLITGLIIMGFIIYYIKNAEDNFIIPLSFIFGGAFSNLIDRIIFKGVLDFINFYFWPIFNIADSFITIGIIILIYLIIIEEYFNKTNNN
jgi:signal peptidase II